MDRKTFLKNSTLSALLLGLGAPKIEAKEGSAPLAQNAEAPILGFEHLPLYNDEIMKDMIYHAASTRGRADHGWLQSNFSFSFASYHNPQRMNFGCLRVLNDDSVSPARGFARHPHDNMEIVSIPLSGALEHKDSMGNSTIIKTGELQIMSAGTGVKHSEYNQSADEEVKFLQIWVFPKLLNVKPRYEQRQFSAADRKNRWQPVVAPIDSNKGQALGIHQDAWFSLCELDAAKELRYTMQGKKTGLYLFAISGTYRVEGKQLTTRDALGLWNRQDIQIEAQNKGLLLAIEVPMNLPRYG